MTRKYAYQTWQNPSSERCGVGASQTSSMHTIAAKPSQTTMDIFSPLCSNREHLDSLYSRQKAGGQSVPLYDISKDLFEDTIGPPEAATKIASFVFSNDDFRTVYLDVINFIVGAAQSFSEERNLCKLANLTLAISRLPDARNESQEPLWLSFNYKINEIGPGEVIVVDDRRIWADLPQFGVNLCDSMYGPTAYISDGLAEHFAERRWTNLNTFAAYLIHGINDTPCSLDYLYLYTFRTITDSLEYDSRTEKGIDSLHSLRSACRWIMIAGEQIWTETMQKPHYASAGPLWHEKSDAHLLAEEEWKECCLIGPKRWLAWAHRLDELAEGNMIEDELKDMARTCAEVIRTFEREWVFFAADETREQQEEVT